MTTPPTDSAEGTPKDAFTVPTKTCVMCAESIPIAARMCKHCDAYQDWRKWISTSQATLALVVALVSVLGSAGPTIVKAVRGENSQLTATYQSIIERRALFIVANAGSRPGSISNPVLQIASDNQSAGEASIRIPLLASKPSEHLVPAGTSVGILLAPEERSISDIEGTFKIAELPPRNCYLKITLVDFDGNEKLYSSKQSCRVLIGRFWPGKGSEFVSKHFPPEA